MARRYDVLLGLVLVLIIPVLVVKVNVVWTDGDFDPDNPNYDFP